MVIQCKGCVWEYAEHNARFSVVPAGKSGTTWKHISADTDGHIHQCTSGVAIKNSFDVVLVVLGTNDIPLTVGKTAGTFSNNDAKRDVRAAWISEGKSSGCSHCYQPGRQF